MRIPRKFIDPNRVDGELAAVLNNRDTICFEQPHGIGELSGLATQTCLTHCN